MLCTKIRRKSNIGLLLKFIGIFSAFSGTIIAGLCAPCCAKSELGIKDYSCVSACVIIGVGFLQLLLTACFLIGWVWSAIWGIALIGTACKYRKVII